MYKLGPFKFLRSHSSESFQNKLILKYQLNLPQTGLILLNGKTGSGKSTLMALMKGLYPDYLIGHLEGECSFGLDSKDILYLFQNPYTQTIHAEVKEEFFFSMENAKFSKEEMQKAQEYFSNHFKLQNIWDKKSNHLSHGECQKLVLASLMALKPKVLLLDEPTAFIDEDSRKLIYQHLAQLKKDRLIIMTDHNDINREIGVVDQVIQIDTEGEISIKIEAIQKVSLHELKIDKNNINPLKENLCLDQLIGAKKSRPQLKMIATNLSFNFRPATILFSQVNVTAESGDVLGFTGVNGAGKSTLFQVLARMLKEINGKVEYWFNGELIKSSKVFELIGYVFQNPESHFLFDSIGEEFQVATELKNKFENENFVMMLEKLFFQKLDLKQSPFTLSEGEKRKLSILLMLIQQKEFIFYDEPTFGQDDESIGQIIDLILRLKLAGKVQMIISHDAKFLHAVTDKLYTLNNNTLTELEKKL